MFAEIKNTFYNEKEKYYAIDAWRTKNNMEEEGIVIAKVYIDKVSYTRPNYEKLPEVQEKIKEAKSFFKIETNDTSIGV